MGSFNTVCFVSQQTIAPGDKAVILPIEQQATYDSVELLVPTHNGVKEISKFGYSHSSCYPTSFWGYSGPIIKGEYDDYGQFILLNSKDNQENVVSFFNLLAKKVCDVKEGENKVHDIPLAFKEIYDIKKKYSFDELVEIWEKVWEVGQQSRLFINNRDNDPRPVAFAVMHQCSADYLISKISKGKNYSGKSLSQKSYFNSYINEKLSRMFEVFKDKKEKADIVTFAAIGMMSLDGFGVGEQEGSYISQYYKNGESAVDKTIDYFKNNPEATSIPREITDEIFVEFKSQIEHRYLAAGLTVMNLKLTPMIYGSQDYDNSLGDAYCKMINDLNAKVKKLVKERNGEDFEEEVVTSRKKPKL